MGPDGFCALFSIASTAKPRGALPSTSRLSGDYELSQIPTINRNFATEHDNLLDG